MSDRSDSVAAAAHARLLRTYLDDHWAGAGAGVALAHRLATEAAHDDAPWAAELARVAGDITDDERALQVIRDRHHCTRSSMKRAVAIASERVGALHVIGRSADHLALARLLDLELLMSGVQGKRCLWRALRESERQHVDVSLESMEQRAVEQLTALARIHELTAVAAFVDGRPSATEGS